MVDKNVENLVYRSPYEAYPFLSDGSDDLRCDFELLTDEMASKTGLLLAHVQESIELFAGVEKHICEDLKWVCEMIYHINPTLRTHLTVTIQECGQLKKMVEQLEGQVKGRCEKFVLPVGGKLACEAHVLRVQAKKMVRLIYRHIEYGNETPELLLDFVNLLSGYFFFLALWLNAVEGVDEILFVSRNYTK